MMYHNNYKTTNYTPDYKPYSIQKPVETYITKDTEVNNSVSFPPCCENCPNRPSENNRYTSTCWCALPALTNPITVL